MHNREKYTILTSDLLWILTSYSFSSFIGTYKTESLILVP
jgi:hypothetical protein